MDDLKLRRSIRAIAMGLGTVPTFVLWPTHNSVAAIWAVLVGLSSPIVYTMGIRVLAHYFPWLDTKLSARPIIRYDDKGNVTGIRMEPDNPNDKTIYIHPTDKPPENLK